MPIAVTDLQASVWSLLQKNSTYSGFFTSAKVLEAINDSLDYVYAKMAVEATDLGWLNMLTYASPAAGDEKVEIPSGVDVIRAVRFLVANQYVELFYDSGIETKQFAANSGVTQFPSRYRIINDASKTYIYFNPPLGMGGTNYLQIEHVSLPANATIAGVNVDWRINKILANYVKFRAASICACSVGKANPEWVGYEAQWWDMMQQWINKKVAGTWYVKEFEG